jgi:hypothetical protein
LGDFVTHGNWSTSYLSMKQKPPSKYNG